MSGITLPGNSTVRHVKAGTPEPGYGQVLLRMKASSICGSGIRAIYREHLGAGPEAYQSCQECRHGYMIGCTSGSRAAYGWQRDGGHAEYRACSGHAMAPQAADLTWRARHCHGDRQLARTGASPRDASRCDSRGSWAV
jgi:D-arabinose 1-dehydrogenase-like Zn-dependent alcohol dehydrogenase